MKPILLAIAAALLAACQSHVSANEHDTQDRVEAEVREAFDELATAARNLDHERYFSFLEEDKFSILNVDGTTTHSLEMFRQDFLTQVDAISAYTSLEFDPVVVTVLNAETAILLNEYSANLTLKSGATVSASGAGAQVWSKQSGRWKLVHISNAQKR